MDYSAAIFGIAMLALSAWIAYQWGIKPDREMRKRRTEQLHAQMRRQRDQRIANRVESRDKSAKVTSAATLPRQSPV